VLHLEGPAVDFQASRRGEPAAPGDRVSQEGGSWLQRLDALARLVPHVPDQSRLEHNFSGGTAVAGEFLNSYAPPGESMDTKELLERAEVTLADARRLYWKTAALLAASRGLARDRRAPLFSPRVAAPPGAEREGDGDEPGG
jgi:hypothetical protein